MEYTSFLQQALENFASAEEAKLPIITSILFVKICMGMNYGPAHLQKVRFLYKTILRLHQELPVALQTLGNSYLKDEFKRHKNCNQAEAAQFMMEWTHYAVSMAQQLGLQEQKSSKLKDSASSLGSNIDHKMLDHMREDQLVQLYELLQATKDNNSENKN